jgi:CDP-glucose 4,6-dehydratase
LFENSYRDKVVLVTGHTGFKGAWLSIWLFRLGAHVVGYSLEPPTTPSLFDTCGLANYLQDFRGDIRDAEKLSRLILRTRPDFVFHLAASPLVLRSYANPLETFDVNVVGTVSLLEAIRRSRLNCSVVAVSTDKCYINREWEYGYREEDPLGGRDPYSASKAAMEIAIASFRESFFSQEAAGNGGVRLASARAGNVLGGGDWAPNRIIPDSVRALRANEVLKVRSPKAIRPWQHVLEPLSGYLALGAKLATQRGEHFAGAWNFGPVPTDFYTVANLVDTVISTWGSGSWMSDAASDAPHEAGVLRLCIDKSTSLLGWRPIWDLSETVKRAVLWYRGYYLYPEAPKVIFDSCISDIAQYEAAAFEKGLQWALRSPGPVEKS